MRKVAVIVALGALGGIVMGADELLFDLNLKNVKEKDVPVLEPWRRIVLDPESTADMVISIVPVRSTLTRIPNVSSWP